MDVYAKVNNFLEKGHNVILDIDSNWFNDYFETDYDDIYLYIWTDGTEILEYIKGSLIVGEIELKFFSEEDAQKIIDHTINIEVKYNEH